MTAKMIFQHNSEVVYRSTYQPFTIEEEADGQLQLNIYSFKETTEECVGAKLTHNKLEEVGIPHTPEYIVYIDKDQNEMTFSGLDKEIIALVKKHSAKYLKNAHKKWD